MGDLKLEWENLPELCLFMILDKLDSPCNMVQFGAVCKHWHSVFNDFLDSKRRSSPNVVPMLLIPISKRSKRKRKLYSLQAKAEVSDIELPKSYTKRCCGSCYGWLAIVNKNMIITLSTPFKDVSSIDLPKLEFFTGMAKYQYEIQKVILSADPSSNPDSYMVVVIYGDCCRLAFYKSGNEAWIYIDKNLTLFTDVIFYRSLCYAIGHWNHIVSFDFDGISEECLDSPTFKIVVSKDRRLESYSDRAYLVESSKGNLYSIHKILDVEDAHACAHITKSFKVFKLVLDDRNGELLEKKEVKSIDGDVVFVGDNKTLVVSAFYFPEEQPNSIYFTDDYFDVIPYEPFGPRDIGIFNLKDGSFGQHYRFQPSHKKLPPYIWIQAPPPATVEENKPKPPR